jgi:hypothetical protein
MVTVTINLYSFNELTPIAKQKAIDEHYNFMVSYPPDYEDENGEMKIEEDYNPSEDEVIENIEVNDYYFFWYGRIGEMYKVLRQPSESR